MDVPSADKVLMMVTARSTLNTSILRHYTREIRNIVLFLNNNVSTAAFNSFHFIRRHTEFSKLQRLER